MKLPSTLQKLIAEVAIDDPNGGPNKVIPDFGVFVDTHRDQPHVGSFGLDIHRGECRPVMVNLEILDTTSDPAQLLLVDTANGTSLALHDKHMFVTPEFWSGFLMDYFVANGASPLDGNGVMVTSHLRDARAKVYKLKSFRQMLEARYAAEKAAQTGVTP